MVARKASKRYTIASLDISGMSSADMEHQIAQLAKLMRAEEHESVAAKCRDLLDTMPGHPVVTNILGVTLFKLGEGARAVSLLSDLVREHADYAFAHHNLGNVLSGLGRHDEAVKAHKRAIALQDGHAEMYNSLAAAQEALEAIADGYESACKAVQLDPQEPSHAKRAATLAGRLGRWEEALELLQEASGVAPSDPELQVAIAQVLTQLGRGEAALEAFNRAAALEPDMIGIYTGLGRLWDRYELPSKAEAAYREATARHPASTQAAAMLADFLHQQERLDEARQAYQRCLELDPQDEQARHFLAALSGDKTTSAPMKYVQDLFDGYAPNFERSLVGKLGYDGPSMLSRLVREVAGADRRFAAMLDLGCGTGLMGQAMRGQVDHLCGIDLSANMIREARAKEVYDRLEIGDLLAFLRSEGAGFDLFTAADVLIYLGELDAFFSSLAASAPAGALVVFSTELHLGDGVALRPSGRFAHADGYIRQQAAKAGFDVLHCGTFDLRREGDEMLTGGSYVLRRP